MHKQSTRLWLSSPLRQLVAQAVVRSHRHSFLTLRSGAIVDGTQGKHPKRRLPPIWRLYRVRLARHSAQGACCLLPRRVGVYARGREVAKLTPVLPPQVWDIRRKGCIQQYKGHSDAINAIRFSPDGRWVISGSEDCVVKVGTPSPTISRIQSRSVFFHHFRLNRLASTELGHHCRSSGT